MFLSNVSVKRPVAICCLIIGLFLLGVNAYRKFALELIPKMDLPYVTIVTVYPGASPADIETDVAKKIEDVITEVDGLKHVTSSCMENVCQTLLEFQLGMDVDLAAMDVREKLDTIIRDFPAAVEKPMVLKYDPNAKPVATMALTGDLDLDTLYDYADNTLRDLISVVPGVASVELLGGSQIEVNVLLDRNTLASAGLSSMTVVQAVQDGIFTLPAGRVKENGSEYGVRFDAEYATVKDIRNLQVAGRDGARRFIRDLGLVTMASEERRQAAFIDGRPCIGIRVVKRADTNTVQMVNKVRKAVDRARPNLPGGMELIWVTDDAAYIQASVDSTIENILAGVGLTALILFFFLYNFRATLIAAVTMPVTIIISLFFMHALGITLNKPSLMAVGLSVGILVTNSIVVLESVLTQIQKGRDIWESARTGTSEVAVALLGCSVTNVVVLLPIGMMGSLVGLIFRPFAVTVLIVNLVAIFIAFTLTPILCAVLLKKTIHSQGRLAQLENWWNQTLGYMVGALISLLNIIIRRKWIGACLLGVLALMFIHSLFLVSEVGVAFMTPLDRGQAFIKLEYPTRQNLEKTIRRVHEAEKLVHQVPGLSHVFTQIGKVEGRMGKASEGVYLAQLLVKVPDKTERTFHMEDLVRQLREALRNHTDCIVNVSIPTPTGEEEIPIELEISGEDFVQLDRTALSIQDMMKRDMHGFVDTDTSVREGKPELRILPNRPVLADTGIPIRGLALMTRANIEGLKAGSYRSGARTYDVRVKFQEEQGKSQVEEFLVPTGQHGNVPLTTFATVSEHNALVQITRVDKRRVSKIYSQLSPDLPQGIAMVNLRQAMNERALIPARYEYRFRGVPEDLTEGMLDFLEAGILAVLLTYLAPAATLESFSRPFLILVTLPHALIGVMWSLYLTGESITMFVMLGMVLLIGIVVNNAILILDRMQLLRSQGIESHEALLQAIRQDFRAVLMVTLAAILGMLPLAVSQGLGSELSIGMGISSVGGIAVSAVLTFVAIPTLYILFTRRS